MRKLLGLLVGTGLLLLAAAPGSEAIPIVAFDPAVSSVSAGQTFQVDISISDVNDLYAFQFDLEFDPSIVRVDGVTEGSFLAAVGGTFWDPGTIDNAGGTVAFIFDSLLGPGGATGSGVLATIEFTALMTGTGSLGLLSATFLDSGLMDIAVEGQVGSVDVEGNGIVPVPEPASGLLLLGAIAALAARRARSS